MAVAQVAPTGVERVFPDDEIIVSKTDVKGRITYANAVFLEVSGYTEDEVLGEPHNMVRHPDMPACIFRLLWETIASGREMFAYVRNMCKNGDHYWVHAHVTPTRDANGAIVGYHSNRRVPDRSAIAKVEPLYASLLAEEQRHASHKDGIDAGVALLRATIAATGMTYEEFVWSL